MSIRRSLALLTALILVGGLVATASVHALRWRATILFDRATGRLQDIGWSDLFWMLRPSSGVYLETMAATRNPFKAIQSPQNSKAALEAGMQLFRQYCSGCHGDQGRGGPGGPSLYDYSFRQGRSDWALYRTITLGVPGTAMVGRQMARDDVWRLVSYLQRTLVQTAAAESVPAVLSLEPVTAAELKSAVEHPAEWLMYSGSYAGDRYSRLTQINRGNAADLRVEWERQLETPVDKIETSPVVRGSTMFITEPPNRVHALDASSGRVLWTYTRDLPSRLLLCCEPVNRGVALLGALVFVGTLDAHLVALDARTGKLTWDVEVADHSKGYSITAAPLAIDDMIVTGVAGGEYGVKGFVDAYDATSGKRRWRFYTIPEAGQPGSETWGGNSLRVGGAPTWLTGSFDPELRIIYWGVGNPSPNYYGEKRTGDNLYSNSVVALDADSGKLRWYFQFTPHDLHDWDSAQIPVLADDVVGGRKRKLLAWANRNGFYYLLDRTTGEFLLGTPFVTQTWATGLDEKGRPRTRPESAPSRQGSLVYPSVTGGTNWWSPAYNPELQLVYVPTVDRGSVFYASPDMPLDTLGENLAGEVSMLPNEEMTVAVKALEVTTGSLRWRYVRPPRKRPAQIGGLLSTAGGVVFGGDLESVFALDAGTGAELWHFDVGGLVQAAPVTFEVGGRQFIAVAAGRSILAFALPGPDSRRSPPLTAH